MLVGHFSYDNEVPLLADELLLSPSNSYSFPLAMGNSIPHPLVFLRASSEYQVSTFIERFAGFRELGYTAGGALAGGAIFAFIGLGLYKLQQRWGHCLPSSNNTWYMTSTCLRR
jgi:hypothetical protein